LVLDDERLPPPRVRDALVHLDGVLHVDQISFLHAKLVQLLFRGVLEPDALPSELDGLFVGGA
jgi:hypothetical protein